MKNHKKTDIDVIIIGGGPAGILTSYYLNSFGLSPLILEQKKAGQSWRDMRDGMVMLSPSSAEHDLTSLTYDNPIWSAIDLKGAFADKDEFIRYLEIFIKSNGIKIIEGQEVAAIKKRESGFEVATSGNSRYSSKALVIATGVIGHPRIPRIEGVKDNPKVVHSKYCSDPSSYRGRKVLIVGTGNSGAELAIELAGIAKVTLAGRRKLRFFSKTGDLSHIRGLSESLLKELIKFKIVELREKVQIKAINGGAVIFSDGFTDEYDNIIFATGYAAHLPKMEGMTVRMSKAGYPELSATCESTSVKDLYFTGPLAHNNGLCSFIHCFRPMVEPMALQIAERLGL